MKNTPLPPELAMIANGRDHISTREFAHAIGYKAGTLRLYKCTFGHCFGITPVKIHGKLLWPVAEIASLLRKGYK